MTGHRASAELALAEWWAVERARGARAEQEVRLVATARWCLVALTAATVVALWRASR